jgi:hypothetical protein
MRLKHCWVTADEHGPLPALLLEWRETPDGWQARVVRPWLDVEDEKWRPREEWPPAAMVRSAAHPIEPATPDLEPAGEGGILGGRNAAPRPHPTFAMGGNANGSG